jgi:hypothetical protein
VANVLYEENCKYSVKNEEELDAQVHATEINNAGDHWVENKIAKTAYLIVSFAVKEQYKNTY